jgi:two-component system, OmpR family, copper resistance phosphate regulon response regulator CusR
MKILIVEDEERLAKSLKKALESEGYAVDYVLDGETAEKRILQSRKEYDLLIFDLMLPKKDGLSVIKTVRENKVTVPMLVLTARFEIDDKIKALDTGVDDYLVKPFSLDELFARVRALLRRPVQALPSVLTIGRVSLNPSTRKVTVGGEDVELTLKEFSLLEYLMRHPNQVVSRNQIIDHLWGYDFDSFSNVVDVHIKNLRKKLTLKGDSRNSLLETVRGVGYRIKVK